MYDDDTALSICEINSSKLDLRLYCIGIIINRYIDVPDCTGAKDVLNVCGSVNILSYSITFLDFKSYRYNLAKSKVVNDVSDDRQLYINETA